MLDMVKDLERLEVMLETIENPEFKSRFAGQIEATYLDIYDNYLTDEEKTEVDAGIRDFELQNDGWRRTEIFYEPDGWMARVYQHSWWGHWRVEFYDKKGRNYHYDCQFETEREAEEYAQKWVVSKNRPWG